MFHFTIRDVLWLMVVVAISVSWWIDNKRIEKTLKTFKAEYDAKQLELDDKLEIVNQMNLEAQRRLGYHTLRNFPPNQARRLKSNQDTSP